MTATMTGRQRHKPFTPSGHFGLKKSDTQTNAKVLRLLPTHILKKKIIAMLIWHICFYFFLFLIELAKSKEPNLPALTDSIKPFLPH